MATFSVRWRATTGSSASARSRGMERARLDARGVSISIDDGAIAATSYLANLTVVTANTKHFVPFVALRVVDWSRPSER